MALEITDLGKAVLDTQYAVRGPIVERAQQLERAGKSVIFCNIGNPQALGQKPITRLRQVLALCEYPALLESGRAAAAGIPEDAAETARAIIAGTKHGLGAYSESKGHLFVREAVARFISRRDGTAGTRHAADPGSIFICDGASKGVQLALRMLIASERDGIMIPIPQYPLYSATITLYGGRKVGYLLDEDSGWSLSLPLLEEAYARAVAEGTRVRAITVINPGNPTGAILDRANIEMVVRFAKSHDLSILADEVYQENIYREGDRFVSFAAAMAGMDETGPSLFSFHSCSKGFLGECGQRGGYMEARNIPGDVMAQATKLQSVNLCSNIAGQAAVYLLATPPGEGDPSWPLYRSERDAVIDSLRLRASMLAEGLAAIPGYRCNPIAGAMYAFPRVELPAGRTDEEYCLAMLEETGICVVPGSGFGQATGTAHFRVTILPPVGSIAEVVGRIAAFHARWSR